MVRLSRIIAAPRAMRASLLVPRAAYAERRASRELALAVGSANWTGRVKATSWAHVGAEVTDVARALGIATTSGDRATD